MFFVRFFCGLLKSQGDNDRVALLPFESVALGILKEMRYNPPASTRNCRLKVEHCPCGEYHVGVYLTQEVMDNDMLFPEHNLMAQLTVNATLAAQELAYTSLPVQDFSSLSGAVSPYRGVATMLKRKLTELNWP